MPKTGVGRIMTRARPGPTHDPKEVETPCLEGDGLGRDRVGASVVGAGALRGLGISAPPPVLSFSE